MVAVVWPFGPQIRRAPYVVTREYRTDIFVSRSGREQRRALRQTPRKRIEYVTAQTEDCLRAFDRSMVTAQRTLLAIPERVRFVRLEAGLPGSASSVIIDPVPAWLIEGAQLVLVAPGRAALRTVVDITGTTVTFAEFEDDAWPAGTRLHPSLNGYLETSINAPLTSMKRGVIEVSVNFHVDPGSEVPEASGTAAATLNGREVFLKRPDHWQQVNIDRVQEGAATVDYGFGRVSRFFPIDFSTRVWNAYYSSCDFDHAETLRQLFDRAQGKRGEFYMPTFQEDLIPLTDLTTAGTTITVSGGETDTVYSGDTVFKAIAVKLTSGAWITRLVTGIETSSAGDSVLTISAAWGQNVSLAQIVMVCWLPVWRFASDILTMSWPREDIAQVRMSLQMIENLAVE